MAQLAPTAVCNSCKNQGHIAPVCLKAVARSTTAQDSTVSADSPSAPLALTYDSPSALVYYASANPVYAAYGSSHNLPTPELPL